MTLVPTTRRSICYITRRSLATGTRGARGHGWYQNYRDGKGGRHLQGEYYDARNLDECRAWNESILAMGSTSVYMNVVLEPKRADIDLTKLTGDRFRLEMELASGVMPTTVDNFVQLLPAYQSTSFYRIERGVGLVGGDVLGNSGRAGQAATGAPLSLAVDDPLAMWHLPGTVSMLVSRVGEIDSRFLFVTTPAPHVDGIHRAFGQLSEDSLALVSDWQASLLTRHGVPTSFQMMIDDCGVSGDYQVPDKQQVVRVDGSR